MSRLDELIREFCPDGVEYKRLGSIAVESKEKNKGQRYTAVRTVTNKSELVCTSDYFDRTVTSEDTSGYKVVRENMFVYNPSRINIGSIAYSREKEPIILSPMYVVFSVPQEVLLNEFLLLYLRSGVGMFQLQSKVELGARFRLPFESLAKIKIPIPPLSVQREIVRILDSFTDLTAELEAELEARKKQYEYYRDQLLNFDVHLGGASEALWMTLGELCTVSAGGDAPKESMYKEKTDEYTVPIISNGIGQNAIYGYTDVAKIEDPAVTVAARGTIGYAEYRDYPYYPIIRLLSVIPNNTEVLNTKYLYYTLQGRNYNVPTGGIPQLTAPELKRIKIPVPPLSKQHRIVSILDRFDALCNDLTSGLPAEIAARQKQYEYYRDKLLTFKESSA